MKAQSSILVAALLLCASAVALPIAKQTPNVCNMQDGKFPGPVLPLFKQCDSRWGDDVIETTTVCKVGCLMSSIASALAGHGILVDGQSSNPGTLNAWLRGNGGYDKDNNLEEGVIPKLSARVSWTCSWCGAFRNATAFSIGDIAQQLEQGHVIIANVDAGHHFVIVTGYNITDDVVFVNDSGFDRNCYPMSQVVGWRIFEMDAASAACNGYSVAARAHGAPPSCPNGQFLCKYLPGKSQCCTKGENCVVNVGCRC
jgi:hypothetical protein